MAYGQSKTIKDVQTDRKNNNLQCWRATLTACVKRERLVMSIDAHEKARKSKRYEISGPRIWIPLNMMQGGAYKSVSTTAKALLLDLAGQLRAKYGDIYNNGDLTTALRVLSKRGWKSDKTIRNAAKELEKAGLIVKTRQGCLPNKANLYAVTWLPLNENRKFDISGRGFPLNAYLLQDKPPTLKKINR